MKLRLHRKRNGRNYTYNGTIPRTWVVIDEDGNEYHTVEEVDAALAKEAETKEKAKAKTKTTPKSKTT